MSDTGESPAQQLKPPPKWDPSAGRDTGETLLAGTACRLFGRLFQGLTLNKDSIGRGDRVDLRRDPTLARIYGFSWQGNYFKLGVPTVMLVYGPGTAVPADLGGATIGTVGVEFKDEFFSGEVLMWTSYETEFAVRIDITSGWLSEVLIAPEASDATNATGAGDGTTAGRASLVARGASLVARGASLVGRPPNT